MGFRCTFTMTDYAQAWPDWFRQKYQDTVYVPERGPLAARLECKWYSVWADLLEDIRLAYPWSDADRNPQRPFSLVLVVLHECGGVTRYAIFHDRVVCTEPTAWDRRPYATHSYCYDCHREAEGELNNPDRTIHPSPN